MKFSGAKIKRKGVNIMIHNHITFELYNNAADLLAKKTETCEPYTIYFVKLKKDRCFIPSWYENELRNKTIYARIDKQAFEKYGIHTLEPHDIHPSWNEIEPSQLDYFHAFPKAPSIRELKRQLRMQPRKQLRTKNSNFHKDMTYIGIESKGNCYYFTKPIKQVIAAGKWYNLDIQILEDDSSIIKTKYSQPLNIYVFSIMDNNTKKMVYCPIDDERLARPENIYYCSYSCLRLPYVMKQLGFTQITEYGDCYTYENTDFNETLLIQRAKKYLVNLTFIHDTKNLPEINLPEISPEQTHSFLMLFLKTEFYHTVKVITRKKKEYLISPDLSDNHNVQEKVIIQDAKSKNVIAKTNIKTIVDVLCAESKESNTITFGNLTITIDENNFNQYSESAKRLFSKYDDKQVDYLLYQIKELKKMAFAYLNDFEERTMYVPATAKINPNILPVTLPLTKDGYFASNKVIPLYNNLMKTMPYDGSEPVSLMLCLATYGDKTYKNHCNNPFIENDETTARLCIMPVNTKECFIQAYELKTA